MKLLFVTDTNPFPPRDGRELPTARIAEGLARRCTVDMLVCRAMDAPARSVRQTPGNIRRINEIGYFPRSRTQRALRELTFQEPAFFLGHFNSADIYRLFGNDRYDFVWYSPISTMGLRRAADQMGIRVADHTVLGLNDVKTFQYIDSFRELRSGRFGLDRQRFTNVLRIPFVALNERRCLRRSDIVHVQTELEARRVEILTGNAGVRTIVAPNGVKPQLLRLNRAELVSTHDVLFMTHLSGVRRKEYQWFLHKVWPKIRKEHPSSRLVFVGSPPDEGHELFETSRDDTLILGYAEELTKIYKTVAVTVVPTLHSTGLSNRVVDALASEVPLVTTPQALATVAGAHSGEHALVASTADDFSAAVSRLLRNQEEARDMAHRGRMLARSFPTWPETLQNIASVLQAVHDS